MACPLVNYVYDKLSEYTLVKSMILATIFRWRSCEEIVQRIRAKLATLIEMELDSVMCFDLVSILTRPEILRLFKFTDKEGSIYSLLTSRLELTEK